MRNARREAARDPRPCSSALRDAAYPFELHEPVTVAAFMELALYHPVHGYYATAPRRSGAAGDFFTSVDAGPLFGQALATQLVEMWSRVDSSGAGGPLDLVEAGAGNGRLTRDILDAIAGERPDVYARVRVTLVERSAAAREAAAVTLRAHAPRIAAIADGLPSGVRGVLLANELLDAFPVHVLTMTGSGLREVYVARRNGRLEETMGPVSDARLREGPGAGMLAAGVRAERSLAVPAWMAQAAASIDRGFLLLVDYFRPAGGDGGSLLGYARHAAIARWFDAPGRRDITALVDLEATRRAASASGLDEAGRTDQTYFLTSLGILDRVAACPPGPEALARRLSAKTLILPGGLGSTMKALAFSRQADGRGLRGFLGGRLT